ncbi:hypothetical protein GF373_11900 [bacterium]|nr:hypothetical protein [bacterium]
MRIHIRGTILFCVIMQFALTGFCWEPLPKVDLTRFSIGDFSDGNIDMPFYLYYFHRVANNMVEKGPNRGFIDIPVWRGSDDNEPHNARIMESILSLAYFYTTEKPWNVYYHHPELKKRLKAALNFWCGIQSPEGKFSEYGPKKWNLAGTAFATKFMGETLRLLTQDGTLDQELIERVAAADRKAIWITLTDPQLWEHGLRYSNQFSNVWAGALAYLDLYPDARLQSQFIRRLRQSMDAFQSPAGYFYEKSGPDWQYNMGTHHSNLWMSWHYARGTALEDYFLEKERRWYEWLSYNAVPEPGNEYFVLNRAIETRKGKTCFRRERIPTGSEGNLGEDEIENTALAEKVKIARAYSSTRSTYQADLQFARQQRREQWPNVKALDLSEFSALSPYAFLHRQHVRWLPTREQKQEARESIPFFRQERFIHQRVDSRHPVSYTYYKSPCYYAAFNAGKKLTSQQRYGLGLVWHQEMGALLQSQTGTKEFAWGTREPNGKVVYEGESFTPTFMLGDEKISAKPGCRDLSYGALTVAYPLGEGGSKTVRFTNEGIHVDIVHAGEFYEQFPLLARDYEMMSVTSEMVTIQDGNRAFRIELEGVEKAPHWESKDFIAGKILCGIRMTARDKLSYVLRFPK